MSVVYFSLGTNLGEKYALMKQAILHIEKRIGHVDAQSAFYETEPWGFQSENKFLNSAVKVTTSLAPLQILDETQQIEREMGRMHKSVGGQYSDRLIDIDMLMYDDLVMQTDVLTLPHPLMHERLFVMEPLAEIAPMTIHPVFGETIENLLFKLKQKNEKYGQIYL